MKKIIAVDDDPGILDILELIFSRAGYEVTTYPGAEALLKNDFIHPSAIVMDKQLSGLDGLDVCRFLKGQESTRNIPIIMISANMNIGCMAQKAGADDFVEKPFNIKSLLETVRKYA